MNDNKPEKISDILADESHEAHTTVKNLLAELDAGTISLCGCLGPMYGEPYCLCAMKRCGLEHVMENNPVRKAAEYESAQQWKKFMDEGGFSQWEVE